MTPRRAFFFLSICFLGELDYWGFIFDYQLGVGPFVRLSLITFPNKLFLTMTRASHSTEPSRREQALGLAAADVALWPLKIPSQPM